jgi:hypothetical protein
MIVIVLFIVDYIVEPPSVCLAVFSLSLLDGLRFSRLMVKRGFWWVESPLVHIAVVYRT